MYYKGQGLLPHVAQAPSDHVAFVGRNRTPVPERAVAKAAACELCHITAEAAFGVILVDNM